jgi:regulator of protease activity HflC (stomatin/prohibitin superfamily)
MMQVPSGVHCLLQRFGANLEEAAQPGLHCKPPYYRIAYIVSKQACTYDAPVRECPTSDDVRVNIDVVIVFQIVDAIKFIYKLGAVNFDDYLSATVDEAIRMLVRKESHETVYGLRGDKADYLLKLMNEKFEIGGVIFSGVKITSIWLPDSLAHYLEVSTKMAKAMEKLDRQNEYDRMEIQQESDMAIEEINRKKEQVIVAESGRKKRAELEFEQRSVKAEEDGRVALINAEAKGEIMILKAKTQLNRTNKELETWRVTELARANAEDNKVRVQAELEEEKAIIEASWQEEKMVCEAQATKYDAAAEAEASRCMAAKRRHELDLREKVILTKLAEQGNFNLVGSSGDKMVAAMMTGSFK